MSAVPSVASVCLTVSGATAAAAADPLASFHCTSEVQREYLRNLGHAEIYLQGANGFGKSFIGIGGDLAMMQGRRSLGGIPLPRIPMPARWGLFVPDYKLHRSSTQPIIEALVGDWPHRYERLGPTIVGVRLKPLDWHSDDPHTWSSMTIYSCENPNSGVGARLHGAGFDEPPPEAILREVRKAGEAATVFPVTIRATPLRRSQWHWLREDYPDPEHNTGRIVDGFLRLRGSLYDNSALTPQDIARRERAYRSDPLRMARLYGLELDTEGLSPFRERYAQLMRWFEAARPGEVREWRISREVVTPEGKQLVSETVEVEVWEDFIPGHRYRAICDPSLGIDDGEHDPGAIAIVDMTARAVVAGYRGFIGEYGLAVLAAGLARQYGECLVDPEIGGGYGSAFLSGLRAAKYGKVVNDARSGVDRTRLGFTIAADTRAEFAAAINEALFSAEEGAAWLHIPCRWMLADLVDLVIDEKGRIVTGAGRHDEGFILAGRAASLLTPDRQRLVVRTVRESPREAGVKRLRESMGLPVRSKSRRAVRPRSRAPGR